MWFSESCQYSGLGLIDVLKATLKLVMLSELEDISQYAFCLLVEGFCHILVLCLLANMQCSIFVPCKFAFFLDYQ